MSFMKTLTIAVVVPLFTVVTACSGDRETNAPETNDPETKAEYDLAPGAAINADIVDTAVNAGSFKTLVSAIQAAGLEATLRGVGPFTVFAPNDEAFAKLPAGTIESLLKPENKEQLVSILTYHVLSGTVTSSDIAGKKWNPNTVQGSTVVIDATNGVKVNGANVVKADILTSNGVIHVIDSVIMPASE